MQYDQYPSLGVSTMNDSGQTQIQTHEKAEIIGFFYFEWA